LAEVDGRLAKELWELFAFESLLLPPSIKLGGNALCSGFFPMPFAELIEVDNPPNPEPGTFSKTPRCFTGPPSEAS